MFNIVFKDNTKTMKQHISGIIQNQKMSVFRTEVTDCGDYDMVEIVMENDDRAKWRQMLDSFQVLTSGALTLD
jgi:hypothetical protein